MHTTVRVADDVKRELDRLQGDFLSTRGERLSHSELLARMLRFVRLHEEQLLESEDTQGPTRAAVDRFFATLPSVSIKGRARDFKDELYGDRP